MLTSLLCLVSKDYCRQWWSCQAARDLLLNVCELNAHVIKINDTDITNHVCFLRRAQFSCLYFPGKSTTRLPIKPGSMGGISRDNETNSFTIARIGFDRSCWFLS